MRYKRQNFLAIQSHPKAGIKQEQVETAAMQRVLNKLDKSRSRYAEVKDRDVRLSNYKSQLKELIKHSEKLNKEEQRLRNFYNKLSTDVDVFRATNPLLKQDAEKYWKMLRDISGQKLPLPSVLRSPKIKRSPPKNQNCGICKNTHDQHLLLQCDTCKKHYHLRCLDPPLTRMPKKTAFAGCFSISQTQWPDVSILAGSSSVAN
ncbi:putative PHD finger protein 14 [Apostichopus japonicus]|uniref:Putative PHD finger protein 14 n=1 Tax=Stichopus japonicus TaxID=307972 RepID=A0A2G8LJ08_STIJA|nr:putative PHD finger protein 14 [Apostichopus japonicus]